MNDRKYNLRKNFVITGKFRSHRKSSLLGVYICNWAGLTLIPLPWPRTRVHPVRVAESCVYPCYSVKNGLFLLIVWVCRNYSIVYTQYTRRLRRKIDLDFVNVFERKKILSPVAVSGQGMDIEIKNIMQELSFSLFGEVYNGACLTLIGEIFSPPLTEDSVAIRSGWRNPV